MNGRRRVRGWGSNLTWSGRARDVTLNTFEHYMPQSAYDFI